MKWALLLLTVAALAADNELTPGERKAGWRLLFDGKTMNGWLDPASKIVAGDAWTVEEGTLHNKQRPRIEEDLMSKEVFGDFELMFDWRLEQRGNSGLKYRIQREVFVDQSTVKPGPNEFEGILGRELAGHLSDRGKLAPEGRGFVYTVGFEFQLIDDERHPDAKRGEDRMTGSLYSMIPRAKTAARPAGEWNSGRLVVKGQRFEHWVNGEKVLEGTLTDERVRAGAEKRWSPAPEIREALVNPQAKGRISLQHHGDPVWFKNLKIRVL
jgi:hypothetical protein